MVFSFYKMVCHSLWACGGSLLSTLAKMIAELDRPKTCRVDAIGGFLEGLSLASACFRNIAGHVTRVRARGYSCCLQRAESHLKQTTTYLAAGAGTSQPLLCQYSVDCTTKRVSAKSQFQVNHRRAKLFMQRLR